VQKRGAVSTRHRALSHFQTIRLRTVFCLPNLLAVVPIMSLSLAQAVQHGHDWAAYIERIVQAQVDYSDQVGVFPSRSTKPQVRELGSQSCLRDINRSPPRRVWGNSSRQKSFDVVIWLRESRS
jgi:hypothetical protein